MQQAVAQSLAAELINCGQEGSAGHIHRSRVVSIELMVHDDPSSPQPADIPIGPQGGPGPWTELWTFERCGTPVSYFVSYTPTPEGQLKITTRAVADDSAAPA